MLNVAGERVPSRYRYMAGVLDSLRAMGGEPAVSRVYRWLIDQEIANPADMTTIQKDGGSRFHKEVRWARKELFDAGLLGRSVRGTWTLTDAGRLLELTPEAARRMVSSRASDRRRGPEEPKDIPSADGAGPTTGPLPSNWSGEVARSVYNPTWTYLARFGSRNVWKIGHAADLTGRLADLNKHVPSEVLEEAWSIIDAFPSGNAVTAYKAEQSALNQLQSYRTVGERVCCPEEVLLSSWSLVKASISDMSVYDAA